MGMPRSWRNVRTKWDQPRDDGRGRLTSAIHAGDLSLEPGIPHGIQRTFSNNTFGGIANDMISEWPPYDFGLTVMPHLVISRSIHKPLKATAWSTKSSFDDSIGVASIFVGNPLG